MQEYEKLLERGLAKVPKERQDGSRFKMARPITEPAGAKTIITNFYEIAGSLRREPDELLKFLLKQLATKGDFEGQRLVVLGRFTHEQVANKIELYVKMYVLCPECGKPDTKLVYEEGRELIKCEACGAKSPAGKKG